MTAPQAPPLAGRREWLGLAVLCLPTLLTTVDISVLVLALPKLDVDLGANSSEQLWITDIYGFMIAGFLVTMGALGDRIGHRTVLLAGAAGFIVASLLAAFSTTTMILIGARALLGVAAATVMPSVLALISQMFRDPKQMGAAMGVWGSSTMLGVVLGPVVGGVLLDFFWWGSVFLIGIPIMLLLLILGPRLLPGGRSPFLGPLDLPSVGLSLGALLPTVYGLKEVARLGWHAEGIGAVMCGLGAGILFVQRQRRLEHPLLDLGLFRNPVLRTAVLLSMSFGFVMSGTGLVTALYMQLVADLSPLRVGLWMLVPSVAMVISGNLGPALARKHPPTHVIAGGLGIAAVGVLILTQVSVTGGLAAVVVGLVVMYFGGGPTGPLAGALLMSAAPPHKAGSAGSLSSTGGELGVAMGVAVLGSIATAVYKGAVEVPADAPPEVLFPAREHIAAAVDVADKLPIADANALIESAKDAFTQGLHTVGVVNALLFIVLAIAVLAQTRHLRPPAGAMPGMPPAGAEAPGSPDPANVPGAAPVDDGAPQRAG